ncbi:hypothetical protein GF357_00260, partial [Candidatus Dojkabacteria bacterium]|nr:hypothetical protein [Candidatus Dojkabacteria bacterium]
MKQTAVRIIRKIIIFLLFIIAAESLMLGEIFAWEPDDEPVLLNYYSTTKEDDVIISPHQAVLTDRESFFVSDYVGD